MQGVVGAVAALDALAHRESLKAGYTGFVGYADRGPARHVDFAAPGVLSVLVMGAVPVMNPVAVLVLVLMSPDHVIIDVPKHAGVALSAP